MQKLCSTALFFLALKYERILKIDGNLHTSLPKNSEIYVPYFIMQIADIWYYRTKHSELPTLYLMLLHFTQSKFNILIFQLSYFNSYYAKRADISHIPIFYDSESKEPSSKCHVLCSKYKKNMSFSCNVIVISQYDKYIMKHLPTTSEYC